jgi:gliding motility-associated-like protein
MIKKQLFKWLSVSFFTLIGMVATQSASAQCSPEASGSPCVGAPVSFKANAAGYTDISVLWDFGVGGQGSGQATSSQVDPKFSYSAPGTYTVTFTGQGTFGSCTETFDVVVKPSPKVVNQQLEPAEQCFRGNRFVFVDSSEAAPGSELVRRTYLLSDGQLDESISPKLGDTIIFEILDPRGGAFDLTIELEDKNGCVTKEFYPAIIYVWPRLGIEFSSNRPVQCDSALAVLQNLTYQNWLADSNSYIGLKDIARFIWDFGDGNQIVGDSVTNTEWWTGEDSNGVVEYWYKTAGTFDGTLTVEAAFGCTESFTFKSTATTIKLEPRIVADKDSACSDDATRTFSVPNVDFTQLSGFLWNFGDPPSGPDNFNDEDDSPSHSYGLGPWMISVRMVQGPCDVMAYDTITILGPGSTIEVPFVRVAEAEKYQCVIRDSVRFVNNSGFYHNDPSISDEDSIHLVNSRNSMKITSYFTDSLATCLDGCDDSTIYFVDSTTEFIWEGEYALNGDNFKIEEYDSTVVLFVDTTTSFDTTYRPDGSILQIDTLTKIAGDTFILDYAWVIINGDTLTLMETDSVIPVPPPFGQDTFAQVRLLNDTLLKRNDTIWFDDAKTRFYTLTWGDSIKFENVIAYDTFDFVFNYNPITRGGDQTAIPKVIPQVRNKDHVWRVWDLGDTYAPQCTTDTRANRNVNKNCNYTLDSLPVHWYTPWDDIYMYENDGQFYTQPVRRTLFARNSRQCFQVQVWAFDTLALPDDLDISYPSNILVDSAIRWAFDQERTNLFTSTLTASDTFRIMVDSIRNENDSVIGIHTPMRWIYVPAGSTVESDSLQAFYQPRDTSVLAFDTLDQATGEGYFAINQDARYYLTSGTDFFANPDSMDLLLNQVDSMIIGPVICSATEADEKYRLTPGSNLWVKNFNGTTPGTAHTGQKDVTIEVDHEYKLFDCCDTLIGVMNLDYTAGRVIRATASQFIKDTTIFVNGIPQETTVTVDSIIVDPEFHRDFFYQETARCNTVTLWHKDTIHAPQCESTNNISLALIPPNSEGLRWEGGIPCPITGVFNPSYFLTFSMAETKPGCSQQWFEVNYDSLLTPNGWNMYKDGNVLAPPPPGLPIPFILPYDIIGQWGTQWLKGYSPGEIGNDPKARPNGSFTLGLIIGNGPPQFNADGSPAPPECMDTTWYSDMFRFQFMDAAWDIVVPQDEPKYICAGEEAWFELNTLNQDSISVLAWRWGYPTRLDAYVELFNYYQPWDGPSPTRNDRNADTTGKNGKPWIYNYVIRQELTTEFGTVTLDTIVTTVIRDWKVEYDPTVANDLIEDAFEQLGLNLFEIPPSDIPLYLGDGTVGCIDTTGISQFFQFGIVPYSEKVDDLVFVDGKYRYRYTDTTKTDSVIVAEIFHFRDSSLQGYDTLAIDTNGDGTIDSIPGLWRHKYVHPVVVSDPCDNSIKDTIWRRSNGLMNPGLSLFNQTGCNSGNTTKELVVGYFNEFELEDKAVCKGDQVYVKDSILYYLYGDPNNPDYPYNRRTYWKEPARAASENKFEHKRVDWDKEDGVEDFSYSDEFRFTYDEPGEYLIRVATRDSLGCRDTAELKAFVTGVISGMETNIPDPSSSATSACQNIVSFFDSSVVLDPCSVSDTCKNGTNIACDSIIAHEWDFGDGTRTSILENPSHDYTSGGFFEVTHVVWTALGCSDTSRKTIFIPGPQPHFDILNSFYSPDSIIICLGETVDILNNSREPLQDPEWTIDWGDNEFDGFTTLDTFTHLYKDTGTYFLYLTQFDSIPGAGGIRCSRIFPDTSSFIIDTLRQFRKVVVLPVAPADFTISDTIVCPDELVTFDVKYPETDTLYKRFDWDFGDNVGTDNGSQVTYAYSDEGTYTVTMVPDYTPQDPRRPKCLDTASHDLMVIGVKADFGIDSTEKPLFKFSDSSSSNVVAWKWLFENFDGTITEVTDQNPEYSWGEDRGKFQVCLIVTSEEGCEDTICKEITNDYIARIVPYNIFTPSTDGNVEGGDGYNDVFQIDIEGQEEYNIKIYNRWGELMFESDDPENSWNGSVNNQNKTLCPDGTYFYLINYKFERREKNDGLGPIQGTVTLIRE